MAATDTEAPLSARIFSTVVEASRTPISSGEDSVPTATATPVCAAADGVILTVSRGQQRPLVEKAIQHLMSIGAKFAGVVFNRAHPSDFRSSPFGSGASSPSVDPAPSPAPLPTTTRFARFGPLVHAVAAAMPAEQN